MISNELKAIYSSESTVRSYDTLILSHPNFTNSWYFVQDIISHDWQIENGTTVTFQPMNFDLVLPTIGSNQQDMSIVMDNTNLQLIKELNKAATNILEPIQLVHNVYIDTDVVPQSNPINLTFTNVVVKKDQLSGVASSKDTIGRSFLSESYDYRFKGLFL